jgi:hypothetical protein
MRRKIDKFEFGWMNGKSTFEFNPNYINGSYIKYNNDYIYFDIKFDKNNMKYIIRHSMKFEYPWCSMNDCLVCGEYKTKKGERKLKREESVKKIILDWFIGMYGSEQLLEEYFDKDYGFIKIKYDNIYQEYWNKNYTATQNAMKNFKENFCI